MAVQAVHTRVVCTTNDTSLPARSPPARLFLFSDEEIWSCTILSLLFCLVSWAFKNHTMRVGELGDSGMYNMCTYICIHIYISVPFIATLLDILILVSIPVDIRDLYIYMYTYIHVSIQTCV